MCEKKRSKYWGEIRNVGGKTLDEQGFPKIIVQVSGLMGC